MGTVTLNVNVETGPLAELLRIDAATLSRATRTVILRTGTTVKNALRRVLERAGLGKLAKAVQREVTRVPKGVRGLVDVQVAVRSKALVKRPGGVFDFVLVFAEGATIVGRPYLAVPFPNIGRGPRGRKLTPDDFKGQLEFVPLVPNKLGLLRTKDGEPKFWVVRKVVLRSRYDLQAALKSLEAVTPKIIREWDRLRARQSGGLPRAA